MAMCFAKFPPICAASPAVIAGLHLGVQEEKFMRQAFERMNLTARTYYKVLCVARTIADLEEAEEISLVHLREALSYRMIDKKYWGRDEM